MLRRGVSREMAGMISVSERLVRSQEPGWSTLRAGPGLAFHPFCLRSAE
jgi:hypothetical protein